MVTADVHLARKALAGVSASVRDGETADWIGDVPPRWVAFPSSVEEASALLRAAAEHDLSVVPRGGGSRLGWGSPVTACDLVIDMTRMDQVLEHVAGDLVARVQAGARMGDIAATLARAGQEIALDVPPDATAGGVIASGLAGPRRLRYGSPRDLLIGVTIVRADGTVARSGGKVVKNVAGYDLGKLLAGSAGTLGLIAEATFRLHPLPAARRYVTASYDSDADLVRAVADAAGSPLVPSAVEIRRADGTAEIGVLLEGSADGVSARSADMAALLSPGGTTPSGSTHSASRGTPPDPRAPRGMADGKANISATRPPEITAEPPRWWLAGKRVPGGGTLIGVSFWVSALGLVLETVDAAAREHSLNPVVAGSAGAGFVHVGLGPSADPAAVGPFTGVLRAALAGPRGSVTVLTAPAPVRAALADHGGMTGPLPSARLMRAVRDQFDPDGRMSPGRFAFEGT